MRVLWNMVRRRIDKAMSRKKKDEEGEFVRAMMSKFSWDDGPRLLAILMDGSKISVEFTWAQIDAFMRDAEANQRHSKSTVTKIFSGDGA